MRRLFSKVMWDDRGVIGVEFAIVAPVLVVMLGSVTDFALAFWTKGVLANSVAEGAEYASIAGPSVLAADIKSVVGQKLSLPAPAITVTGPSCYCVSGTPATSALQANCKPCPDGSTPGTYVNISAQYTYKPLLPLYSQLASPVLVETTMTRLK